MNADFQALVLLTGSFLLSLLNNQPTSTETGRKTPKANNRHSARLSCTPSSIQMPADIKAVSTIPAPSNAKLSLSFLPRRRIQNHRNKHLSGEARCRSKAPVRFQTCLLHHNVHELARHHDELDGLLAFKCCFNFLVGQGALMNH